MMGGPGRSAHPRAGRPDRRHPARPRRQRLDLDADGGDHDVEVVRWPLAATGNLDLTRPRGDPLADPPPAAPCAGWRSRGSNLTGAVPPLVAPSGGPRRWCPVHLDAVARAPPAHEPPRPGRRLADDVGLLRYGPHAGGAGPRAELLTDVEAYRAARRLRGAALRPDRHRRSRPWPAGAPPPHGRGAGGRGRRARDRPAPPPEGTACGASWGHRPRPHRRRRAGPDLPFSVDGHAPATVAETAAAHVSVWHGHPTPLELIDALGLTEAGGAVRASIVRYNDGSDVDRPFDVVDRPNPRPDLRPQVGDELVQRTAGLKRKPWPNRCRCRGRRPARPRSRSPSAMRATPMSRQS